MEIARALDVKRILFLVMMLIITLALPFSIYGANGRFDIKSILFHILYDMSDTSVSIQYILDHDILLPSLLICAPCILWLFKAKNMRPRILLGSAGLVIFVLTWILLAFLPIWAVLPWFYQGAILAYVPKFIDLVPFSGLAFTIMILLPLIWRGLVYPQSNGDTLRGKIAAALSVFVLLAPLTIETFSWQGSDFNLNYFEGFSLNAVPWDMSYRVSGSRWGQNEWFNFAIPSIYASLALILLLLPGIIFVWFVLKSPYDRNRVVSMITAGVVHILIVSLACYWINITSSHAGIWVMTPFPILIVGGLIIAAVHASYQWIRRRSALVTDKTTKEPIPSQM